MHRNLLYCIDKSYAKNLYVSLSSFLAHHDDVTIHVLHNGLSLSEIEEFQDYVCQKNNGNKIRFYEVELHLDNCPLNNHFTSVSYYRLFWADYLKINSNKILYVDADTVFNSAIDEIFEIDLSCEVIAAVEDPGYRGSNLIDKNPPVFFNSGFMLINLKLWEEYKIKEKVLSYISQNPDRIQFVDQCGLNAVIADSWYPLHPRYNMQTSFFWKITHLTTFSEDALQLAKTAPAMIHYNGESKPWMFMDYHPYRFLYYRYLKLTPYHDYTPIDRTLRNVLTKNYKKVYRAFLKRRGLDKHTKRTKHSTPRAG